MMKRQLKQVTDATTNHCPGDMAVRMRKVLTRPWVGVGVCNLLLLYFCCGKAEVVSTVVHVLQVYPQCTD